jgi:outer membrane protein
MGGGSEQGASIDNAPRTARLQLQVPIFAGLRDLELAKALRAEREGSRQSRARILQNLYLDLSEAFYQVLNYERDLAILGDIEKNYLDRVADQEKRVRLGKSRESEAIQARNALAQARVSVEKTRGLLGASRELLLFYLGVPEARLKLQDTSAAPPNSTTLADYLARSGERPDILAAVQAEKAARSRLSSAKGGHWPTIKFEGNYYLYDSERIQDGEWNGFLTLDLPLFDGGSIEARVDENKALFARQQLDLSRLRREVTRDVRTAWNNFHSSLAELARLAEALQTAELNALAQQADYALGTVNSLGVLDALRSLHDTRREHATTGINTRLNLIKLHVAAGSLDTQQPASAASH